MGMLRCCSAVVPAVIAACIAAGLQPGTAAAADLPPSPADLSQQSSPSTGSGPGPNESTADQVEAAVTGQVATALAAAGQDATSVANDVANSVSGVAAPAVAIASSATTAVAGAVDNATQDVAPTQSGGGTFTGGTQPPPSSGDLPGGVPPPDSTPGAGTGQSPGADAGAPQTQPSTPTDVPPLNVSPDPSPSSPAADSSQPAKSTTGADGATAHRGKASAGAPAAAYVRVPSAQPPPPSPPNRVGGLVGGTSAAAAAKILADQSADTTAKRLNPLKSLAHGSRIVARIVPHDLPSAALSRGLGGDGALMMRIAKLLAVVYAGFLIIWFWATRVRWNGR
jgi:hypothetical protein